MKTRLILVLALAIGFMWNRTFSAAATADRKSAARSSEQPPASVRERSPDRKPVRRPKVQIAILLDTSGSMDGLIGQAKSQLWKLVNEFVTAKRSGQTPLLEVALYEYGKSSLPAAEGYLRMIQPLTGDLDKLSEELFALRTNGGDEYCGWVIKSAAESLAWSSEPEDFKVIFIAGNEPFTQGPIDYRTACKSAIAKGIIVNTIHCGPHTTGINTKWEEGAQLADGKYTHIDQNLAVVHRTAPQDPEIAQLGEALNRTYFAFGTRGAEGRSRQAKQDENALQLAPAAAVERTVSKSSSSYQNSGWDLIDGVKNGQVKLETLEPGQLPKELKEMNLPQQREFVAEKMKEREAIQHRIQTLNRERTRYLAEESKQTVTTNTLDAALIRTLREQAGKKMFRFE
jgi:hypothetical protein